METSLHYKRKTFIYKTFSLSMYSDKKYRAEHLADFKRVYDRVSKEANVNPYRLKRIQECINLCQD